MSAQDNDSDVEIKLLENFVLSNPELEQLESLLSEFNLFEAIGAVRTEVRHSDFLAFLLDPSQNHCMGDFFLNRLLQRTLTTNADVSAGVRSVDLALMDLSNTVVRREWEHVDILCVNEENRLVVLIENKIDSGEGKNQLRQYLKVLEREYPEARFKRIAIFLTPDGAAPSDNTYLRLDYALICSTLEELLIGRQSVMRPDVVTAIKHYVQMLRRHIVSDSPVAELAKRIYAKHGKALDLIFEHRPDEQLEWRYRLQNMIRSNPDLLLDHCTKGAVRFIPKEWNMIADLNRGQGWTPTKRILLFQFDNVPPEYVRLRLFIGPSEAGADGVRHLLHNASRENNTLFQAQNTLTPKWSKIWGKTFLTNKDFESGDDLDEKTLEKWNSFVGSELPILVSAVNCLFIKNIA